MRHKLYREALAAGRKTMPPLSKHTDLLKSAGGKAEPKKEEEPAEIGK